MDEIDPLTDQDGLAAMFALVKMFDKVGCPLVWVEEKDEHGISFLVRFGANRARALAATCSEELREAANSYQF